MKTSRLVSAVVAGHCVVIGAIMLVQGCGTTGQVSATPPPEPVMPGETTPPPQISSPVVQPRKAALPPVAKPPVRSWPTETTAYTVQKGDSISLICSRFHVSRAEVMALNRITDANKIRVGQQLQLPGKVNLGAPKPTPKKKVAAAAAPAKPASAPAPVVAGEGEYVVKAGDALSKIASRNGTTVAALKSVNGLTSDRIRVGQKLKLPGAAAAVEASAPAPAAPAAPEAPAPVAAPAAPVENVDADMAPAGDVPPPPPSAPAPTSFRAHTVEPGEDLFHVSLMWDVKVEELQRINGLGTNTVLVPGQQLQIPLP